MLLEKTLNTLEYYVIKEMLAELTSCEIARELIRNLQPMTDLEAVETALRETEDAVLFIIKRGMPPAVRCERYPKSDSTPGLQAG